MKHLKTLLSIAAIILVLVSAAALSVWRVNPPAADESDPAFVSMMGNIQRLATGVRWVGTPEVQATRDALIAEIEAMGLTPTIHRTAFTMDDWFEAGVRIRLLQNEAANAPRLADWGMGDAETWGYWQLRFIEQVFPEHPIIHQGYMYVDNIWVTLESPSPNAGSIMFVAHYDSMWNTPGAADAMLPTAAMLEALRVHAANSNLANNMHFLFTDAEEVFALGALAFSRDFPEIIDEVDMLLNLEAVGNSGGVINFQTSDAPFEMIRVFNRAAPRPIGFHWGDWVYRTAMSGSFTDFNFFREYGFSGLNFAILGGNEHYHTPTDNYENLNRNTAWHYLITIMAMADYAAANPIAGIGAPSSDAIFFPFLPGMNMIVLTTTVANILTGLAFAVAIAFLVYRFKTGLHKSWFITILLGLLMVATVFVIVALPVLSYLLWIPLLAVSASAFLKKWGIAYKCAMTASGAIAMLLCIPPVYLLLTLFQII